MASRDLDKMLREMAQVRGFKLVKSRRRKPGGDFGRYGLRDAKTGKDCFGFGDGELKADATEVENFLRGQVQSDWKSSLSAPDLVAKPVPRRRSAAEDKAGPESRERRRPEAKPSSRPAARMPAKPPAVPRPVPEKKAELRIRTATRKDASVIAKMLEGASAPTSRRIMAMIEALAARERPVLVADEDGILGVASYDLITALQRSAPLGRVTFLFTNKQHRRRGIGTALLKEVEARLRKLGCETIELVHDIELSNANSFLRRHGYARSGYRFARPAGED